ncbi:hypothetical protein [Microvirus mar16]|uniref:Uncharacterized protein n=1 Tax=Microvirus mar16 TaxID=2851148 RepID=A0A8F5XPI2_9VIRU|nr:hypothetical protein [Microvirus mar16]
MLTDILSVLEEIRTLITIWFAVWCAIRLMYFFVDFGQK